MAHILEYCDIFSVKDLDLDVDLRISNLDSQNKCILKGYFLDNQLFDGEVKISSREKSGYHNMFASPYLQIVTNEKTYFLDVNNNNNLSTSEFDIIVNNPLFMLYSEIFLDFKEIFSISFDSIRKIGNSAVNSVIDRNSESIMNTVLSMGLNLNTWSTLNKKELMSEYSGIDEIIRFRNGIVD